jgi:hypothetical protein
LSFRLLIANRFRSQGSAPLVADSKSRAASCLRRRESRVPCVSIFRRRRAVRRIASERPLRRRCLVSISPPASVVFDSSFRSKQLGLGSCSTVSFFFCCASSSRLSSLGARRQVLSHHHCRASVLEFGQQFSSLSTGTPCNEFQIPLDFRFQSILTEHAGRPYHIASVLGLRQMHSFRHRRHALQGLSFLAAAVVSVFLTIFRFARATGSVTHRR